MRALALATLTASAMALSACATTSSGTAASLVGTEWKLVELNGQAVNLERAPDLTLDANESRAFGFGGCNRYFGEYNLAGSTLKFGRLGATMMACMEGMELERSYLDAINAVDNYKLRGNTLELYKGDALQLRYQQK